MPTSFEIVVLNNNDIVAWNVKYRTYKVIMGLLKLHKRDQVLFEHTMSTLYVSQKKVNMNSRNQRRKPLSPENIRSGIIKRGSSRRLLPQRRTKRTTRRETTQQQEREGRIRV